MIVRTDDSNYFVLCFVCTLTLSYFLGGVSAEHTAQTYIIIFTFVIYYCADAVASYVLYGEGNQVAIQI